MMTAMLTARNILAGEQLYDTWDVNEDAEYHEAGASESAKRCEASGSYLRRCDGPEWLSWHQPRSSDATC